MTGQVIPGWLAGWNIPGCLPDCEPAWFAVETAEDAATLTAAWNEAASFLADEAEASLEAEIGDLDSDARVADWARLWANIKATDPDDGESSWHWHLPAVGLVFWIVPGDDPEADLDPESDDPEPLR